jgi:UDP-2-acetamido-2-deoxy-ribo-hexuluronate aminotransferase
VNSTQVSRRIQMVDVVGQYRRYQDELDTAILDVVRSGAYINGPKVKEFELSQAAYLGVRHAIGCASGTDALQIALMAIGLQPGDEVITTPFTFVATTETIALLGGVPVYVDIDPDTFNLNVDRIEERITSKTKAILPVHLFGQPCDMTTINVIARKHNLFVIEDAAQAIGATWQGQHVGGLGHIGCISYYPSKNLGAFGDAGMIATNDAELEARIRSICNHGASVTYHHDRLGVNSRLDSIQAAILGVKLKYLDEWNETRAQAARTYTAAFAASAGKVKTPTVHPDAVSIWHQYSIILEGGRDRVSAYLKERSIPHNIYYPIPLHLQPAYRAYGGEMGMYPHSEYAAANILSLPMHSELTTEDVEYIAEQVIEAVNR